MPEEIFQAARLCHKPQIRVGTGLDGVHYGGTFKVLVRKSCAILQLRKFDQAFGKKFATLAKVPQKEAKKLRKQLFKVLIWQNSGFYAGSAGSKL
jgi:hypothetical protein